MTLRVSLPWHPPSLFPRPRQADYTPADCIAVLKWLRQRDAGYQ